jgi:hypothetical protein
MASLAAASFGAADIGDVGQRSVWSFGAPHRWIVSIRHDAPDSFAAEVQLAAFQWRSRELITPALRPASLRHTSVRFGAL